MIIYTSLFCGLYFQIFLLVTFVESQFGKKGRGAGNTGISRTETAAGAAPDTLPHVSVIVPCFNEERTIEATIHSIFGLNYPAKKLDIIIVDDGSKDNTWKKARALMRRFPDRIRAVSKENGGKHTAINLALEMTEAQFIACLDADSFVHPEALARIIPHFDDARVMAVTPAMRVHEPKTFLQLAQKAEYDLGIFIKRVFGLLNAIHVTPGPFSVFRTNVFKEIGVFKAAHNTEDMEIAFRIQSHGYRIANCHTALVYTVTPDTVKKLHRQRTRWTYGFLNNVIDYRRMLFNPKYGHMAFLTIPFSIVSIAGALYVAGDFVMNGIQIAYHAVERWVTIGIHFGMPRFDLLSFDVSSRTFLIPLILGLMFLLVLLGKRLATNSLKPSRDLVYFFTIYGFIAPFWIGKAVYNTVLAKKTPWR